MTSFYARIIVQQCHQNRRKSSLGFLHMIDISTCTLDQYRTQPPIGDTLADANQVGLATTAELLTFNLRLTPTALETMLLDRFSFLAGPTEFL